jgi:NTE family protein
MREWQTFAVKKRALVLGGGGLVGIAWEVGLIVGLAQEGIDLTGKFAPDGTKPDVIVGTSAGSMVGAVMTNHSLEQLSELAINGNTDVIAETMTHLDFAMMQECFAAWQKVDDSRESTMVVCDYANRASTVDEIRYVESMESTLGNEWPDTRFHCFAVNTTSGERAVWSADSEVDLARAVASSCSVPTVFPPITIDDGNTNDRYTDGGVHSGTNLDWVAGYEKVLVFAPIGSWVGDSLDALAAQGVKSETALVEAAGSHVIALFTDDATNQATLVSALGRMDPTMREPAFRNGIRQGVELAARLRGWW